MSIIADLKYFSIDPQDTQSFYSVQYKTEDSPIVLPYPGIVRNDNVGGQWMFATPDPSVLVDIAPGDLCVLHLDSTRTIMYAAKVNAANTLAKLDVLIGVPQVSLTTGQYGFFQIAGSFNGINVSGAGFGDDTPVGLNVTTAGALSVLTTGCRAISNLHTTSNTSSGQIEAYAANRIVLSTATA